jgi:two-component system, NarL family, nitrate/nitrite response regulator NarL
MGTVSRSNRRKEKLRSVPGIIVHSSALFRAGLMHILSGSPFRIMASCSALADVPERIFGDGDCVALMGIGKDPEPVLSGIAPLKRQHIGLRVIVLSDRLQANQFVAAISAGADGYLLKDEISADALLKSLELVLVNGVVVPHGFLNLLNGKLEAHAALPAALQRELGQEYEPTVSAREATQADHRCRLSDRERLILNLLTQGASNKHIARELAIAEATVKVHVKSLLRKIRVTNRTQAAMWAMNHDRLNGGAGNGQATYLSAGVVSRIC